MNVDVETLARALHAVALDDVLPDGAIDDAWLTATESTRFEYREKATAVLAWAKRIKALAVVAVAAHDRDARLGTGACHSDCDGDCVWRECPQLRDNEPAKSGRHCPYDKRRDNEF